MRILLVGCCHGQLDRIYEAAKSAQAELVLIAGDFQATRDEADLESMAVPLKYRRMGDYEKYHKGYSVAPILTLVIGGNHEASRHMLEYTEGGWLAHNIWYMGRVGVVKVGGLTIGGMSGVYAPEHYELDHFETVPLDSKTVRSVYHQRRVDCERLKKYPGKLDLVMSHDWPRGAAESGNLEELLRKKPFLNRDIESGRLGSPAAREVLDSLRPRYWLSAHMHIYYESEVNGTQFVALDKAESRRRFWKLLELPQGQGDTPGQGGLRVPKRWAQTR